MRITLKQLEVFIAVAQSGSVTRAADSLNITQSATSMSLADFETQLGRKLFDRVGKRLQLNDSGRLLLPKALDAIARISEIEAMAASDAPLIGQLRIGASLTIGNYMLPGLIGSFMRDHAGAHVTLDVANTRHVIHALEQFQIDIGFIEGFCHEPDIEVIPWCRDELVVFAAANHPLATQQTVTSADLADADWILREPGSGTREIFDNAVLGRLPRIKLLMEFSHTEALKRAVETGIGIGCASRRTLDEALINGSVVVLPTPFLDLERQLFLLIHRQKYRTQGLEAFLTHCRQAFPSQSFAPPPHQ
ncbi:MAG: LysR family transcriptional regulator [Moraxellaceae bacterium]|nr:LysR family transcriptional regulator [Moraxellaceae bacterium]MBP9046096.1 LysR family transcriptional regulator [Moraxellaceae bacterium]